jgi:glycosyltransferase involved in cell wall biosynthesis
MDDRADQVNANKSDAAARQAVQPASYQDPEEGLVFEQEGCELAQVIQRLLPGGGSIREAGSLGEAGRMAGAGAEDSRYNLVFEKAELYETGWLDPAAEAQYDLVWHVDLAGQSTVEKIRSLLARMAARSRRYVLLLLPNQACQTYWLRQSEAALQMEQGFGVEVPLLDLGGIFQAAGLRLAGQTYLGRQRSEGHLQKLPNLDEDLRKVLLAFHRATDTDPALTSFFQAALGIVAGEDREVPEEWKLLQVGSPAEIAALQAVVAAFVSTSQLASYRTSRSIHDLSQEAQELRDRLQASLDELVVLKSQYNEALHTISDLQWRAASPIVKIQRISKRAVQVIKVEGVETFGEKVFEKTVGKIFKLDRGEPADADEAQKIEPLVPSLDLTISMKAKPVEVTPQFPEAAPDKFDVVVFPIIDWHFRYQRPQQLATCLAEQGHRVFYLHTTFHPGTEIRVMQEKENIFLVDLPGPEDVNINNQVMDDRLSEWCSEILQFLQTGMKLTSPVCLVDLPYWTPLVLSLRESFAWKIVLDYLDRFGDFSTVSKDMSAQETILLRESDLVLAPSRTLFEEIKGVSRNCLLIPNSGDFEHFYTKGKSFKPLLRHLKRPILGYYGAISDWFDSELVGWLAASHPEWNFVLIGSTYGADLRPFDGLDNIHLLGEKKYQDLPAYLNQFDICIIPFKKTPLTEVTNPVKLYEFLSAGKPVVATCLKELMHYKDYVDLASTEEEWLWAVNRALSEAKTEMLFEKRTAFARQNTWVMRGSQLHAAITALFENEPPQPMNEQVV